ncbi:MAG: EamA family transporter [Gammaproteobacteria bacterium]|nr:EamA family transporter [Gammaproteobacteria bacterium]
MPITHVLLVLLVVIIWGVNFLFVKLSLDEISPLLLCATRFFLASVPAIFFIKLPAGQFRIVALYGLVMFAMQFLFLFIGMRAGMTPGMASLIMQVQVFFSMFFAALLLNEMPRIWQVIGACISFLGIGVVAMHFDSHVSLTGFIFILAAAASWGIGNLITKRADNMNMFVLVIWGSFVACFPTLFLSFIIEGPKNILTTYQHVTWLGLTSLFYIVFASTWIGYGIWNWLLSRHRVGLIVPFTLLVPIVGVLTSVLILDEPLQTWKLTAGFLVIAGLVINLGLFRSRSIISPASLNE